jgi:DNA-binding CsgD family transcriptional regulator
MGQSQKDCPIGVLIVALIVLSQLLRRGFFCVGVTFPKVGLPDGADLIPLTRIHNAFRIAAIFASPASSSPLLLSPMAALTTPRTVALRISLVLLLLLPLSLHNISLLKDASLLQQNNVYETIISVSHHTSAETATNDMETTILRLVQNLSLHAAEISKEFDITNHTVLHLPCQSARIPNLETLTKYIPTYARRITVIYDCKNATLNWKLDHVPGSLPTTLMESLALLFPLSTISVQTSQDCTLLQLLQADHLVCVAAPTCLAVGLVSSRSVTILVNKDNNQYDKELAEIRKTRPKLQIVTDATTTCHHLRGRVGHWRFEPHLHKRLLYKIQPSPELEYRLWIPAKRNFSADPQKHAKFVWDDVACSAEPIQLVSKQGFCRAMQKLNYTRLFVLGDSLQYMALLSLSMLMGEVPHVLMHISPRNPDLHTVQWMECGNGFQIEIHFERYNHLWPIYGDTTEHSLEARNRAAKMRINTDPTMHGAEPFEYFQCLGGPRRLYPDHQDFCPWVYHYLNSSQPTIFWMGVGAHFHHLHAFDESLRNFERFWIGPQRRPHDWIIVRTVSPGHENCTLFDEPYESFAAYFQHGVTTLYDWHYFQEYNRRMQQLVWRHDGQNGTKVTLHDIYWMTALRRDGHPSAEDCLHYLLPGKFMIDYLQREQI